LVKTPSASRKSKPRTSQLKLAGIATIQPDAPVEKSPRQAAKTAAKSDLKQEAKADPKQNGKSDAKLELKDEPKSEAKAEPKAEPKTDANTTSKTDRAVADEPVTPFVVNHSKTA
jgi:ribonuclease-3